MCLRKPRARREEDKQLRQQDILTAAARLFDTRDYASLRMDDIAREARLAKGTLYLYFRTKEEVFLTLQSEEVRQWLQNANALLQAYPEKKIPADVFAAAFVASLQMAPRLLRLMALLHTVLEQNVASSSLLRFKHAMREDIEGFGPPLATRLGLPTGQGAQLLMRLYALLIGIWQVAEPAPGVRDVLASDERFALFRLDFAEELRFGATALIAAMAAAEKSRQKSAKQAVKTAKVPS
jgi:AcrR family transcriptional regulator